MANKLSGNRLQRVAVTAAIVLSAAAVTIYHALNPDPNDYEAFADLRFHPMAYVLGDLFPTFLLAPVVYWMTGRPMERLTAWAQGVKFGIFSIGYIATSTWRPEHRVGLAVACSGGAVLGIATGYVTSGLARWGFIAWLDRRFDDAMIWALIGAFLAGTAVYCYQIFSQGEATKEGPNAQPTVGVPVISKNNHSGEAAGTGN